MSLRWFRLVIVLVKRRAGTYDHSRLRNLDPVRSPFEKLASAELVARSVTTSESSVLYVLFLLLWSWDSFNWTTKLPSHSPVSGFLVHDNPLVMKVVHHQTCQNRNNRPGVSHDTLTLDRLTPSCLPISLSVAKIFHALNNQRLAVPAKNMHPTKTCVFT